MTLWRWLISLFWRAPDDPASESQRRVADVVAADASRAASTLPPSQAASRPPIVTLAGRAPPPPRPFLANGPLDVSLPPASNPTTAIGGTLSDRVLYSIVAGLILLTLVLMVAVRWMSAIVGGASGRAP